jgi:hypothetical protein
VTGDDLRARIPASVVRWLSPVCVLAYSAGIVSVVIGLVLDSTLALLIAVVLLLVGLCSMAGYCVSKDS